MDFGAESLLDLQTDEQVSLPPLDNMFMPPLFPPLLSNSAGAETVKEQSNDVDVTTPLNGENGLCKLEKGREYAMLNIVKQMNIIRPLMADVNNEYTVRNNATELDKLFIDLQNVHEAYIKELSDATDIELAQQWYNQQDFYVFEFKQQLIEYLERAKAEQSPRHKTRSCKSVTSNKTRSSVASSASVQAKLLATKAKAATLKVKAAFLKEKQAIRIAAEELDLKQQMAEVKVEEQIYEQELSDHGSVGIENPNSPKCPEVAWGPCAINVNEPVVQSTPLNPNAQSFPLPPIKTVNREPVSNVNESNKKPGPTESIIDPLQGYNQMRPDPYEQFLKIQQKQIELTETIAAQQLKSSLPTHKPPVFSGDVMEYPAFIAAFETLIESKDKDPTNLLYYLEQYTSGKAKELIKGCLQRKSTCSYQDARALLEKHYGDPYKIASAYITKLSNWPSIKPNDGTKLNEFAILLNQARSAMVGMEHMNDLNTAHVLKNLWEKLPRYLRSKWCERANNIKCVKGQATFEDFAQFVTKQADLANDPIYSMEELSTTRKDNLYGQRRDQRNKGSSFTTRSTSSNYPGTSKCHLCQKFHDLDQCFEFKRKSLAERKDFVKTKGLCFGCYGADHIAKFCKKRKVCQECQKRHPTTLHDGNWKSNVKNIEKVDTQKSNTESTDKDGEIEKVGSACSVVCEVTEAGDTPISLGILPVWLYHESNPDNKIATYALLDNASSGTFVREESLNKLKVKGSNTKLLLTTMLGTQEVPTKAVEGLIVEHFQQPDVNIQLPRTYARQQIPADRSEIPRPEAVKKWPHLHSIANRLSAYMEDVEVGILIGLNCPGVLRPRDVIHGKEDEPYAVKSLLGWYVNGPVDGDTRSAATCNNVHVATSRPSNDARGYVTIERKVKEVITPDEVREMFEIEFNEREHEVALSQEDRTFLKKAEEGIRHKDAHYEMPLPLKNENVQFPNNRPAAEQRLSSLKKRLQHDAQYRSDYVKFMNGIIENGYACKVDQDRLSANDRFSTWKKAKLSVAHCRRYVRRLKSKIGEERCKRTTRSRARSTDEVDSTQAVSVKELEDAEVLIIKWAQREAFSKEIEVLQRLQNDTTPKDRKFAKAKKANMKKASGIWRLDPFLDDNGVVRVGGRIKRAKMEENVKHPIILPRKGHVTTLILRHIHEKVKHSGRGITLNELRASGYWVVKGNAAVRSIISKCVLCRHLRGTVGEQKMADLPESRLEPAPPFTYCAVDYFGPWLIKQGRKDVKRYGVLFTCMASRAIHLEVAESLETDSFILALRRFIARRGPVRQISSDQGTNFVGADNELKRACEEMDEGQIKNVMLDNNIDWRRNPPVASHFGGVWERQIKSVRSVLAALMKEHGHYLNDEALRTLLCETEAIVNGRPLTVESLSDPLSAPPLTPMTLLTGKSKIVLPPPGKFQRADLYCRRRWRQVQHLTNEFWKRWRQEFLQGLQRRNKWNKERRNFQENDVVLVKDKDLPRNQWSLAKVVNVNPDPQDLVRSVTIKMPNGLKLDRPIEAET